MIDINDRTSIERRDSPPTAIQHLSIAFQASGQPFRRRNIVRIFAQPVGVNIVGTRLDSLVVEWRNQQKVNQASVVMSYDVNNQQRFVAGCLRFLVTFVEAYFTSIAAIASYLST